uniref:Peptidase A1 domain-containing protein n=1 Tax=Brassica campestris TaxID=3711 RepID=M4FIE8_BRACM
MKTVGANTIFRLMICFLFVAITAFGVVSGENEVVSDYFGRPVKINASYHIYVRSNPPLRQWITQLPIWPSCSDLVCMMSNHLNHFQQLNIHFTGVYCKQSGYWIIRSKPYEHVLLTGSRSSNNDSTFIIKKSVGKFYSLAFGSADKPKDLSLKDDEFIDVAGNGVVALLICSFESSLHHQAFLTSGSISQPLSQPWISIICFFSLPYLKSQFQNLSPISNLLLCLCIHATDKWRRFQAVCGGEEGTRSPAFKSGAFACSLECESRSIKLIFNLFEKRGGRVQLKPMVMPQSKFDYVDKGDVVYGKALSLSSINHGVGSIIGETGQCEAPIHFLLQRWVPNITTKFLCKDGFVGVVR